MNPVSNIPKINILENQKNWSIINQNIQSIGNSIDQLNDLLYDYDNCLCVCLTEHWKTEDQLQNFAVEGYYTAASFCREGTNSHGGSAIFVRNCLPVKERIDIKKLTIEGVIECCACEFVVNHVWFVLVAVYRPPGGNLPEFLEVFDRILSMTVSESVC